ncbi:MAG TPA: 30S ribosomal protein S12 methylthiotransferase RimO [Candidatus Paceibacterota bacterium]|nr:30S ribosomal protein S12 methylthiotransferase RimO [Verrucomicrobiota bacterium]HSA12943.1 30S ribosomal protein S12 methylthiotransferase RimO [Candidatus Paceibacterota bacterium]
MIADAKERPVRVGLISLGCAKNLVDSEVMVGMLLKDGVEITNDTAQADVVIVNTCSFIESAQQESVDAILESAGLRRAKRRGQGLIVAGCLTQRFREQLPALLPEVDAFMGVDQVAQVTNIVREVMARRGGSAGLKPHPRSPRRAGVRGAPASSSQTEAFLLTVTPRPRYIPDYATPRFRLTPRHFAYVKIAEGCNHPCSFCIIPRIRGSHRSRAQGDIIAEARALIADGVRELNLISQDSTYYGMDLRPGRGGAIAAPERFAAAVKSLPGGTTTICTLLRELNALPGEFWIRLLYTHPAHWTDELMRTIAECPKVARYVDIPLQHIHQNMLERMRRETSRQYIVDLLRRIRAAIPGIALRTTFIVGFPGETEACFEDLLSFIREARFERLGVFTYSQEEGTRAGQMTGQLSDALKRKRRSLAMAAQHEVAVRVAESFVGRTLKVLVEQAASPAELRRARVSSWEHGLIRGRDRHMAGLKGRFLVARGEADAPDIDGRVYVRGGLPVGQFARVKVVGHTDYDLIAEPC